MTGRRSFLRAALMGLTGAVVAPELDIDKLLWVPGEKTIFLPMFGEVIDECCFSYEFGDAHENILGREARNIFMPRWIIDAQLRYLRALQMATSDVGLRYVPTGQTIRPRLPQRYDVSLREAPRAVSLEGYPVRRPRARG